MVNVQLLDTVMEKIKTDRDHWNQDHWRRDPGLVDKVVDLADGLEVKPVTCNTAFCFAGWTVHLDPAGPARWADGVEYLWANEHDYPKDVGDGVITVQDRAARLLDLPRGDADALFDGDLGYDDMQEIVAELKKTL